jgi:hypothetical protein
VTRRTVLPHTVDGLQRRLSKHDREIADLNRVRNPPPASTAPQAEMFHAEVENVGNITGTSSGSLQFRWDQWDWTYHTRGVTGLDSPATSVTVPAGLWVLTFSLRVQKGSGTAPSTGSVDLFLTSPADDGGRAQVDGPEIGSYGEIRLNVTDVFLLTEASALGVGYSANLDQPFSVQVGYFSGAQIPNAAGIIRGG